MKNRLYVSSLVILCLGSVFMGGCADTTLTDTVSGHIMINAPAATVFDYMNGKDAAQEWDPYLKSMTNQDGEGFGSTYDWTYDIQGQTMKGKGVVTEFIPNRKQVLKSSGEIDSTWTIMWVPRGNQTKLIIVIEYSLQVPKAAGMAKDALAQKNQEGLDEMLANVKEKVEKK